MVCSGAVAWYFRRATSHTRDVSILEVPTHGFGTLACRDARYIIRGPLPAAPDHVRRDVYDELWRRGREPASLVALVGLGGVG